MGPALAAGAGVFNPPCASQRGVGGRCGARGRWGYGFAGISWGPHVVGGPHVFSKGETLGVEHVWKLVSSGDLQGGNNISGGFLMTPSI